MFKKKFDIVIVGGNIIGASLAIYLKKKGFSVALIEKNNIYKFCSNKFP